MKQHNEWAIFFHSSEQIRKQSSQLNIIKKDQKMAWTLHAVRIRPRHKMPGKYYTRQWTSNPKVNPNFVSNFKAFLELCKTKSVAILYLVGLFLLTSDTHASGYVSLWKNKTGKNSRFRFFSSFWVKLLDMSRTQAHRLATRPFDTMTQNPIIVNTT
jgi:hypothetical protein